MGWDEPAELRAALWKDPASLAILEAVEQIAATDPTVISGQRKGVHQLLAHRAIRGDAAAEGRAREKLGLKVEPEVSAHLSPSVSKESWSERLTTVVELDASDQVDAKIGRLFALAAERG